MPDWEALRRSVSGAVLLPGGEAFERARTPFVAGFTDVAPQAVVRCATAEDVGAVIGFARRHGIDTAIRSGGHSFAGHSSTRGIVIDTTPMRSVVVANGVAQVGAGARLGELVEILLADGVTIPAGTCPSVGIAGLTLGGGHGILGRRYGLTLDHLQSAQVVLADGRLVECDEHDDADLFWALRGAGGGNFGVVTSFTFRTLPAPSMTNFRLVWSSPHATAVIGAWQRWAPYGPDELAADLELRATDDPGADSVVEVYGALLGGGRDARDLLDDLVTRVGSDPVAAFCAEMSYLDTVRYQASPGGGDELGWSGSRRGFRFTKSGFFARALPDEAITALVDGVTRAHRPGQTRSVLFAPWGGAYNGRSRDATAFVHRDQLFLLEHLITLPADASTPDKEAAQTWVRGSWRSVQATASGAVYPNFPDPDLLDWGRAYYGENYARLLRVKASYDPDAVFRFPQSLPFRG